MAKAPAVVIIVRHGARLDAADKSWHLTSPAPYDPPLTYGGWVQSRALGLRIASLLHAREKDNDSANTTPRDSPTPDGQDETHTKGKGKQKKRKHKVVIHTSPFQRCVETSVGISAGLSQYQGLPPSSRKSSDVRIKTVSQLHSASPRLSAVDSPRLESIYEPLSKLTELKLSTDEVQQPDKAKLRVDAFLGEWLSPDYFEMITHPPNSTMMIANAKSVLLRQDDDIHQFTPTAPKATGMWGTATPPASSSQSPARDSRHSYRIAHRRDRASSHSSLAAASGKHAHSHGFAHTHTHGHGHAHSRPNPGSGSVPQRPHIDTHYKQETAGYTPPVPTYAVSSSDPIPRGYVTHAKDSCAHVDFQWDSMREPQYWGDGGAYGEEWSAMHKRFRRGLNSMIQWYNEGHDEKETEDQDQDNDEDEDLVLVLVTHGAGCNALIGALTNQPVLIDVGMASLTMAVRKGNATFPSSDDTTVSRPAAGDTDPVGQRRPPVRRNSTDVGLSAMYDLKIVASSEHLRPGVDPANASIPIPSSPRLSSQRTPEYRRRYNSAAAQAGAGAPIESAGSPTQSSASTVGPSGIRRGSVASAAPQKMRTYSLAAATQVQSALEEMKAQTNSPTGLWSPVNDKPASPIQDYILNFSNSPDGSRPSSRPTSRPSSRPTSRPTSARGGARNPNDDISPRATPLGAMTPVDKDAEEAAEIEKEKDSAISDLPIAGSAVPNSLGRSLSQKGLWGSAPSGRVSREQGVSKRRWTLQQEN